VSLHFRVSSNLRAMVPDGRFLFSQGSNPLESNPRDLRDTERFQPLDTFARVFDCTSMWAVTYNYACRSRQPTVSFSIDKGAFGVTPGRPGSQDLQSGRVDHGRLALQRVWFKHVSDMHGLHDLHNLIFSTGLPGMHDLTVRVEQWGARD